MVRLPRKIYLRAMRKQWKVSYVESSGKLLLVELSHRELVLYGKNYSKKAALHLITRWIRLKAHDYLDHLLKQLNRRVKANYKKLVIRSHEAQWGSYSTSRTISLNYKLIFLPKALVQHIGYHELCHVRYLSHSPRFWQEVAKYDKQWVSHREKLNDADHYIPDWVIF